MSRDTIILACSGPSLAEVDLSTANAPIAAISTAIRYVKNPDYWFLIDDSNSDYGADAGRGFLCDASLRKVIADHGWISADWKNVERVPYNEGEKEDAGRVFMDGKMPYIRAFHRSVIFATQWFCLHGFKRVVFAGCELHTRTDRAHVWGDAMADDNARFQNQGHDSTLKVLKDWYPIALSNGVEFLSWTPVSPINEFMKRYEPDGSRSPDAVLGGRREGTADLQRVVAEA